MPMLILLLLALAFGNFSLAAAPEKTPPNILLIYADDLGYGDIGAYGAKRIPTPNMDRLAKEGVRFTSAYATSATCTPSRYSILTGEYAWRRKGTGILPGDAAMIIEPGRTTLPAVLKKAGYHTAAVGKWHLGLGSDAVNWNGEIKPGPMEVGFDESYIMAATLDRVPCVFVRGHRVENLDPADPLFVSYTQPFPGEPTGKTNPELLKLRPSHGHDQAIVNGIPRIGFFKGGKAAIWNDEEISERITAEALSFIERNQNHPFFLYFAMPEPHVPRVPNPRFVGKTPLGARGDVIVEADAAVGKVLDLLDRLKLADNTLVIFTSDNGPILDDGYRDDAVEKNGDHKPGGPFTGGKYQVFEAGTRVPFMVRWPGRPVRPGVSDAVISQIDLVASFAALTGQSFDSKTAPDSQNFLPALLGESSSGREWVVEHNGYASLALRVGPWKYIPASSVPKSKSGGKGKPAGSRTDLLFDLSKDPAEKTNLAAEMPEKVAELKSRLEEIRKPLKAQ